MGKTNVTPKRMHQGGITLLALAACIPHPKAPLIETHDTTDKKKTVQWRELPRVALIKAPRPKGRGFPAMWFHHIVPLDPVLKDGACGALSGQIGNGYSGEGDEDIRSSWDVSVYVHRHFE